MKYNQTLGTLLRQLREEKNIPLRKVAAYVDIDTSTLSKIERGIVLPSKDCIPAFADYFEMKLDELLIYFYTDKFLKDLITEDNYEEVLKFTKSKIEYYRSISVDQITLTFE